MKILFIVNDPPYGTERCFNAFRPALALLKDEEKPEMGVVTRRAVSVGRRIVAQVLASACDCAV